MARKVRPAKRAAALSDDEASDVEPQPLASWRNSPSPDDQDPMDGAQLSRNGAKASVEAEKEDEGEDEEDGDEEGDLDEDE